MKSCFTLEKSDNDILNDCVQFCAQETSNKTYTAAILDIFFPWIFFPLLISAQKHMT